MKNKKHIFLIFSLFVLMFSLSGCAGLRNVRPVSCHVEKVSPHGFYNIGMKIALGIENPSVQFAVSEVEAVLKLPDGPVAHMTSSPFIVQRKSCEVYPIDLEITLMKGFYINRLLKMWQDPREISLYTVDVSARVRLKGGASKKLNYQDIPVEKLIQMTR